MLKHAKRLKSIPQEVFFLLLRRVSSKHSLCESPEKIRSRRGSALLVRPTWRRTVQPSRTVRLCANNEYTNAIAFLAAGCRRAPNAPALRLSMRGPIEHAAVAFRPSPHQSRKKHSYPSLQESATGGCTSTGPAVLPGLLRDREELGSGESPARLAFPEPWVSAFLPRDRAEYWPSYRP